MLAQSRQDHKKDAFVMMTRVVSGCHESDGEGAAFRAPTRMPMALELSTVDLDCFCNSVANILLNTSEIPKIDREREKKRERMTLATTTGLAHVLFIVVLFFKLLPWSTKILRK